MKNDNSIWSSKGDARTNERARSLTNISKLAMHNKLINTKKKILIKKVAGVKNIYIFCWL